jgi:hypothetical protein
VTVPERDASAPLESTERMIGAERDAMLRRLYDELEIRNLLARLSHLADRGTVDEYLRLWTVDAVWIGTAGRFQGHEALRERVERFRREGVQGPGTNTRHVSSTRYIEFDGPDRALAESYFVYYVDVDSSPKPTRVGRYVDELRRLPDGWRMSSRRITLTDD